MSPFLASGSGSRVSGEEILPFAQCITGRAFQAGYFSGFFGRKPRKIDPGGPGGAPQRVPAKQSRRAARSGRPAVAVVQAAEVLQVDDPAAFDPRIHARRRRVRARRLMRSPGVVALQSLVESECTALPIAITWSKHSRRSVPILGCTAVREPPITK
jgi:hypothetical protein